MASARAPPYRDSGDWGHSESSSDNSGRSALTPPGSDEQASPKDDKYDDKERPANEVEPAQRLLEEVARIKNDMERKDVKLRRLCAKGYTAATMARDVEELRNELYKAEERLHEQQSVDDSQHFKNVKQSKPKTVNAASKNGGGSIKLAAAAQQAQRDAEHLREERDHVAAYFHNLNKETVAARAAKLGSAVGDSSQMKKHRSAPEDIAPGLQIKKQSVNTALPPSPVAAELVPTRRGLSVVEYGLSSHANGAKGDEGDKRFHDGGENTDYIGDNYGPLQASSIDEPLWTFSSVNAIDNQQSHDEALDMPNLESDSSEQLQHRLMMDLIEDVRHMHSEAIRKEQLRNRVLGGPRMLTTMRRERERAAGNDANDRKRAPHWGSVPCASPKLHTFEHVQAQMQQHNIAALAENQRPFSRAGARQVHSPQSEADFDCHECANWGCDQCKPDWFDTLIQDQTEHAHQAHDAINDTFGTTNNLGQETVISRLGTEDKEMLPALISQPYKDVHKTEYKSKSRSLDVHSAGQPHDLPDAVASFVKLTHGRFTASEAADILEMCGGHFDMAYGIYGGLDAGFLREIFEAWHVSRDGHMDLPAAVRTALEEDIALAMSRKDKDDSNKENEAMLKQDLVMPFIDLAAPKFATAETVADSVVSDGDACEWTNAMDLALLLARSQSSSHSWSSIAGMLEMPVNACKERYKTIKATEHESKPAKKQQEELEKKNQQVETTEITEPKVEASSIADGKWDSTAFGSLHNVDESGGCWGTGPTIPITQKIGWACSDDGGRAQGGGWGDAVEPAGDSCGCIEPTTEPKTTGWGDGDNDGGGFGDAGDVRWDTHPAACPCWGCGGLPNTTVDAAAGNVNIQDSPEPTDPTPKTYTVTYWATVECGDQTIHIPVDSNNVTGPKKNILDGPAKKVWKWVQDKGLGDRIGLQDAFDLANDMQGDDEEEVEAVEEDDKSVYHARAHSFGWSSKTRSRPESVVPSEKDWCGQCDWVLPNCACVQGDRW